MPIGNGRKIRARYNANVALQKGNHFTLCYSYYMSAEHRHSIWIVPEGEVGHQLQTHAEELANSNNTPHFVPHITIAANIAGEHSDVELGICMLAKKLGKFTITLDGYGYTAEEFRSLYILAQSPMLDTVYEETKKVFPEVADQHFQSLPHMSVLYGHIPLATKQQIIAQSPLPPLEFPVTSLDLYRTHGAISDWHFVQGFTLDDQQNQ